MLPWIPVSGLGLGFVRMGPQFWVCIYKGNFKRQTSAFFTVTSACLYNFKILKQVFDRFIQSLCANFRGKSYHYTDLYIQQVSLQLLTNLRLRSEFHQRQTFSM